MNFLKINKEKENFLISEERIPLYLSTKFIKQILNENFNLDVPMNNVVYSNIPLEISNSLRNAEVNHRNETFYLYVVEDFSNIHINDQCVDAKKKKMRLT